MIARTSGFYIPESDSDILGSRVLNSGPWLHESECQTGLRLGFRGTDRLELTFQPGPIG